MQKNNTKSKIGIGAAITAAAAAAAAGAYFLYGKDGAKNRKAVKAWTLKMKGEVLEKMEKMKEIDQETYLTVVSEIADKYRRLKNLSAEEVGAVAKELHGHWKSIQSHGNSKPKRKSASPRRKSVKSAK